MKFKTRVLFLFIGLTLCSCSKNDDNNQNNNPNIPNAVFDTGSLINTSLPQFSQMQFPNNYISLNSTYGINGVVLYYAGNNNYRAFELSDPNHALNSCSNLTRNGDIVTCSCDDDNSYSISSGGLPFSNTTGEYPLVSYFVEVNGDIIRIYNN